MPVSYNQHQACGIFKVGDHHWAFTCINSVRHVLGLDNINLFFWLLNFELKLLYRSGTGITLHLRYIWHVCIPEGSWKDLVPLRELRAASKDARGSPSA